MLVLIRKLLDKLTREKSTALVLQPAYEHNGTFTRLVESDTGIVRGYHYRCDCGQEQAEYTACASNLRGICVCNKQFDLLRSLNGRELSVLPTRTIAVIRQSAPTYRVIGESNNGEVTWTGAPPSSGVRWR